MKKSAIAALLAVFVALVVATFYGGGGRAETVSLNGIGSQTIGWTAFGCGVGSYQSLTDGASVTWNVAVNRCGTLTLSHTRSTRTLNLSSPQAGSFYWILLLQDATGGAQITLGTGCTWKVGGNGGGYVALTNGPAAVDALAVAYDGTYCYVVFKPDFS